MTQVIDRGSAPLDPNADSLYDSFGKVNDNFVETSEWPVVDLDKYGVAPGNTPQTNVDAINNVIANIKTSTVKGVHLKLNRAATYQVTQGSSPEHAQRYACIMLPSNCKFELGTGTTLQLAKPDGSGEQQSYIFRNDDPLGGNQNIELCGGTLDGNYPTNSFNDIIVPGQQGYYSTNVWWENIIRLHQHDMRHINPARYCQAETKLKIAVFQRIHFDNTWKDGFHFAAECYDVVIRDIFGQTGDNTLPISTRTNEYQGQSGSYFQGEYNWADGTSVAGNIERFWVENINMKDSNGPIALFGHRGDHMHDITIDGVFGNATGQYAIATKHYPLVGACPEIRRLTIRNVKMATRASVGTSDACVWLESASGTKDVTLENIEAMNGYAVSLNGSGWDSIRMDNIVNLGQSDRGVIITGANYPLQAKSIQVGRLHCAPKLPCLQYGILTGGDDKWDSFTVDSYRHHQDDENGRPLNLRGGNSMTIKHAHFTTRPGGTTSTCFTGSIGSVVNVDTLLFDNHYQVANARVNVVAQRAHILAKGSLQFGDFSTNVASDNTLLLSTDHKLIADQKVCLNTSGTLPAGLSPNVWYYVRAPLQNAFQVSATPGGTALTFTDDGDGQHSWAVEGIKQTQAEINNQASLSTPRQWIQESITFNDPELDVAATSVAAVTLEMPMGAVVTGIGLRHYQVFRGGSSTASTLEVRLRDPDTLLGSVLDVHTSNPAPGTPINYESIARVGAPTNQVGIVDVILRMTGANCNELTVGKAVAFVEYEIQGGED